MQSCGKVTGVSFVFLANPSLNPFLGVAPDKKVIPELLDCKNPIAAWFSQFLVWLGQQKSRSFPPSPRRDRAQSEIVKIRALQELFFTTPHFAGDWFHLQEVPGSIICFLIWWGSAAPVSWAQVQPLPGSQRLCGRNEGLWQEKCSSTSDANCVRSGSQQELSGCYFTVFIWSILYRVFYNSILYRVFYNTALVLAMLKFHSQ